MGVYEAGREPGSACHRQAWSRRQGGEGRTERVKSAFASFSRPAARNSRDSSPVVNRTNHLGLACSLPFLEPKGMGARDLTYRSNSLSNGHAVFGRCAAVDVVWD